MTRGAEWLKPKAVLLNLSAFPRILRSAYVAQPKGVGSGPSRFSSPSGRFRVLYAAQTFSTAFAEAVIGDRFIERQRRYIGRATLEARWVTVISTNAPLMLVDVRGEAAYALGIDTDAVRARDHTPGQSFSEWLHAESDLEGLLYDSRLTGGACVAVYDRALPKLDPSPAIPFFAHDDLWPEIKRLGIIVRGP